MSDANSGDGVARQALANWVYIEPRQKLTFDERRIREHGETHLSHSLHSRKLVAVLGSGLSRSYGQPSWPVLLQNTASIVQEALKPYREAEKEPAKRSGNYHLNTMIARFDELNLSAVQQSPDDVIINFELCENIYAELIVHQLEQSGGDFRSRSDELFKAKSFLRARLKWQLEDNRGRIEILLGGRDVATELDSGGTNGIYLRVLAQLQYPGRPDDRTITPRQATYAAIFSLIFYKDIHGLDEVVGQFCGHHHDIVSPKTLIDCAAEIRQLRRFESELFVRNFPIPPYPAAGVGVSLPRPDPIISFVHLFDTGKGLNDKAHWDVRTAIDACFLNMSADNKRKYLSNIDILSEAFSNDAKLAKLLQRRARTRHPAFLDPIAILHKDLGIRRFITTNYDAEIDKWLESLGYDEIHVRKDKDMPEALQEAGFQPHGSRSLMIDPFNNRAEIIAYEPGGAPHLFDFGIDTRDQGFHVLHIHGRIRKAESWLVLSEPDYQARYAREDDPIAQSDDAMRLIFNSNPLLFLGLGMTEADILRPLRAYIQSEGSLSDRPSIALLPKLKSLTTTAAEQSKAMSVYGIFNLYYGDAVIEGLPAEPNPNPREDDKTSKTSSLGEMLNAVNAVRDFVSATDWRLATTTADKKKGRKAFHKLSKTARLGVDAIERNFLKFDTDRGTVRQLVTVEESKQHAQAVNHALTQLLHISYALGLDGNHDKFNPLDWKDRAAVDCLLAGVANVILSSFFCARLKAVTHDYQDWQNEWSVASRPRERFGQTVSSDAKPSNPVTLVSPYKMAAESIRQVIILRDLEVEEQDRQAAYRQKHSDPILPMDDDEFADEDAGDSAETDVVSPSALSATGPVATASSSHPSVAPRYPAAPKTDRFFAGHPSPAIITLRAALQDARIQRPTHRRLFLMLGERGHGRGHVFSAMRSQQRFAAMCNWLKITDSTTAKFKNSAAALHTRAIPRAFYNLGLSHEIISVFDRLIQFLQDIVVRNLSDGDADVFHAQMNSIQTDRIRRFETVMQKLDYEGRGRDGKEAGRLAISRRIVICINNLDNLFDACGEPKNAQIGALMDILVSKRYPAAPIDLFLFMNHTTLPTTLVELSKIDPIQALCADNETPGYTHAYVDYLDRLQVEWVNDALKTPVATGGDAWIFAHKLHPMRPITFAIRFFPKVAFALSHLGKHTRGGRDRLTPESSDSLVNYTFGQDETVLEKLGPDREKYLSIFDGLPEFCLSNRQYMQKSLRDAFNDVLLLDAGDEEQIRTYAKIFTNDYIESVSLSLIGSHLNNADKIKKQEMLLQRLRQQVQTYADFNLAKARWNAKRYHSVMAKAEAGNTQRATQDIRDLFNNKDEREKGWRPENDDRAYYFYKLYRAVGHNRYCLTLVTAAIDDMIERRLNSFPEGIVELSPIVRFMERLSLACSSQSPHIRVETTIEQVLLNYKTDVLNSYNTPMAAWPQIFREVPADRDIPIELASTTKDSAVQALFRVESPIIFELQESILAALSLIGQPVTASTLLGISTVAARFDQLFKAIESEPTFVSECRKLAKQPSLSSREKRESVSLVLNLLVHRCLVLRLYPKNNPDELEFHFTVHSSIRRYYLSNMNAHNVDYASIDQMTLSIYSSQPNDMPKPSAEANRRIRHIIEGLSQYENQAFHAFDDPYMDSLDPKVSTQKLDFERLRLRAAFGTMRSFYSVAVVSRFSSYQDEGVSPPEVGYFETHRRRVRWLLRKAYEFDGGHAAPLPRRPDGQAIEHQNPELYTFYAEEQVWMYNECGVVSLAQGRVNDAVSLLIQARLIAREFIEGLGKGAIHAAVNLNLAVANIEGGNLRQARILLKGIVADKGELTAMRLIAEGYLAWIQGLQGDHENAEVKLERVASDLIKHEQFRAAALLLIHRADILLHMGASRFHDTDASLATARNLASNGGHEDVRQLSLMAYYRLLVAKCEGDHDRDAKPIIQQGLAPLIDYAKVMNMPRIASGAALVQAQLLLNEGEYLMASEAAQRALLVATRHNQELVKIDAMYILGTALARQGLDEAKALLIRARELAIHSEYNAKINIIEGVLSSSFR